MRQTRIIGKPSPNKCGVCPYLSSNCQETYEGELKGKPFCVFIDGDPRYLSELESCLCDLGELRDCFTSPYDQYKKHIGKKFKLLKTISKPDKHHDAEALPMYLIKLETGETIEAWPEEIYTGAEIITKC